MKLKNFVLGLGIVIIYALVLWQGIEAFYPAPQWGDFCDNEVGPRVPNLNKDNVCDFPPEVENKQLACGKADGFFVYKYDSNGCVIDGVCDECNILYDDARKIHSRNVFIVSFIVGVVTFILGLTLLKIEPVGSALIGSGIWALFFGSVVNWRNFGAGIRFGLLLFVLIVLIWFTVKLNKRKKKKGFGFSFGLGK